MAGETIGVRGSFVSIISAASIADAAFSGISTAIATALTTGNEADYPYLDFRLTITVNTPAATGLVNVYRRSNADGSGQEPAPSASSKRNFVGSFVLGATAPTTYWYLFGVDNADPSATYYIENADGVSALTCALGVRGRTYNGVA
jgi:hypothetical protein